MYDLVNSIPRNDDSIVDFIITLLLNIISIMELYKFMEFVSEERAKESFWGNFQ